MARLWATHRKDAREKDGETTCPLLASHSSTIPFPTPGALTFKLAVASVTTTATTIDVMSWKLAVMVEMMTMVVAVAVEVVDLVVYRMYVPV